MPGQDRPERADPGRAAEIFWGTGRRPRQRASARAHSAAPGFVMNETSFDTFALSFSSQTFRESRKQAIAKRQVQTVALSEIPFLWGCGASGQRSDGAYVDPSCFCELPL